MTTLARHGARRAAPPLLRSIFSSSSNISPRQKLIRPPMHRSLAVTVTKTITATETPAMDVTVTQSSSSSPSPPPGESEDEALIITASCIRRVKQLASTRPDGDSVYLRVYVDAGGCSGFQYKFELESDSSSPSSDDDDEEEEGGIDPEDDVVFHRDGTRVVIDSASLELLRGSTIDYVQEMIRSSFAVVNNPQSESACGCGSSFAVKNFESNPALD